VYAIVGAILNTILLTKAGPHHVVLWISRKCTYVERCTELKR
jgi:hypothetical protein